MSEPRDHGEARFVNEEARELVRGLETVSNDLAALATFMRAAETMRTERPDAATEQRHLAAIATATARLRADTPAASEAGPSMLGVLRSRWFKAAAIGVAAVLTTGGLAAARMLPAPAQNAVAAVAQAIGIDLPDADDDPASGHRSTQDDPLGDADGDGIPNGEDPVTTAPKDGLDHDGDGVPDDNGNHTGQITPKDGLDHDGDGVPDDNGERAKPSTPPGQELKTAKAENTPPGQETKTPKPEKTEKPDTPSGPQGNGSSNGNANGQDEETQTGQPAKTPKPEKTEKPA